MCRKSHEEGEVCPSREAVGPPRQFEGEAKAAGKKNEAMQVAATTLAYRMHMAANAHARLPPGTMAEAMLFIKQERIVVNALLAHRS
jgi:hypothetical protein